ncbi:nucleotide disphospho-sugar-binding domain-containing protein [Saccharicrinis sp. FJH62]|uniref:nucleotide disphospho-sugar-binding domain-containing protein n=1 Tax=Saccharicrinis sp. FJH62 TaxID=3344657 RepID=UPI0035D3F310
MKKLNFLFVMIDGGGNVPPTFGVIKKLIQRGHSVNVLAEPCLERAVKAMKCNFIPFTDYFIKKDRKEDFLRDHSATLFKNPIFERVIFGPAETVIDQTITVARRQAVNVLMVDILLFPALIAGEFLDIPKMLIFHMPEYMPGPNRPPGNMGLKPGTGILTKMRDRILGKLMISKFNEFKPSLNKIRSGLGLPLLNNTIDLLNMADMRIIQTLKSFDVPIDPAPENVRYAGPVLDDPDWTQSEKWEYPWDKKEKSPLIVISFSSTFQNQLVAVQNCISALKDLPVKGLVTLGLAMENFNFDVPENVKLVNSVQHSQVFPHADIVITHAGHGTVMRALANGVPLICLPMGRDQKDNAIKIEMKGCGIKLSSESKPYKIKKAIERILNDPDFKINAVKIQKEILENPGMDAVLLEIENKVLAHKEHNIVALVE